jgi:hypothetical protein
MNVQRQIYLNPIEPAALSFRAPLGIETTVTVAFMGQNGAPWTQDLAAQLQLTGRTTEITSFYGMPSTDVANGRARAIIPAGDLTDKNGYRLRMVGTYNGEAALMATGTVLLMEATGPEIAPIDTIDSIDLAFERNEDVSLDIKIWADAGKDAPYDLTASNVTIGASVYDFKGGGVIMPFTVTVLAANEIQLTLTTDQVNSLPATCWWALRAGASGGLTTLCEGEVTVSGTVIPPLVETVVLYDYQKPSTGGINPVGGQIIHSGVTQNLLQVAKTTAGLEDFSATLALIRPGDTIMIGVTVWTVSQSIEQAGWYDFTVLPLQQAAPTGETPVTFVRP